MKINSIEPKEYILEGNNKIIADSKSGLERSMIIFRGENNIIYMKGAKLKNSRIVFAGNGAICFLNASSKRYLLDVTLTENNCFYMGKNNSMNGVLGAVISEEKHLFIGDDNMFSHDVLIRNADPHLVYSISTKKRMNPTKSVFIGDHVWIGQDVLLLKGTKIGSGSIIGAGSVVAGKTISSNCSWGGDPVRKISSGVFWSRECVHKWNKKDTASHQIMDTDVFSYEHDDSVYCSFDSIDAALSDNIFIDDKLEFLLKFSKNKEKNRFAIQDSIAVQGEAMQMIDTYNNETIPECIVRIKKEEYKKNCSTYERNRLALNSYKFWKYSPLPSFDEMPIHCFRLDNNRYMCFDKERKRFGDTLEIIRTNEVTHPFFQDLEKPLLVENEYNSFHYEYLCDNVRRSEDYGDDNHIYMFYQDIKLFLCFLCVENIVPYLSDEKIIFLFGDEDKEQYYPMDFKAEYGIDYQKSGVKPVRLDEIKRLIVQWQSAGYSGGTFLAQVCDFHPNLLTVPELAMAEFDILYKEVLESKDVLSAFDAFLSNTVNYIQRELKWLFNVKINKRPSIKSVFDIIAQFFNDNYVPSREEWFVSIYLAYNMALKRNLNDRIAPAIFFSTHPISKHVPINHYYDIFRGFKYLYGIEIIRRPTISLASRLDTMLCNPRKFYRYKSLMSNLVIRLENFLGERKTDDAESIGSCFSDYNHEFLKTRRLVRFEDLKIHPKATLMAMSLFLDLPYDDMLMRTTENGVEIGHTLRGPGSTVKGYDCTPVHNLHENGLSKFDHFRIEVLLGKRYEAYGYNPLFWGGETYSKEDIIKMFEIRFKCENYFCSVDSAGATSENRKIFMDLVKEILNVSPGTAINGRKYVPIPLIKPVPELLAEEIHN